MSEEYKGYEYQLLQDTCPVNPRKDYDHMWTLICYHSRYSIGDEKGIAPDKFPEIIQEIEEAGDLVVPIYLYDHSLLALSAEPFACQWDSGQIGYAHISRERLLQEYALEKKEVAEEKAITILKSELEVYEKYLNGDCWGYVVEDPQGEQVDTCWGFYGQEYCEEAAKEAIDNLPEYVPWTSSVVTHEHRFGTSSFIVRHKGELSEEQAQGLCEDFEQENEYVNVFPLLTDLGDHPGNDSFVTYTGENNG